MFRGLNVLGIPGSLRKGSFNRLLIKNAFMMLPEGSNAIMYDISAIPLFNQDLEKDPPESVRDLKEKIRASDIVLISTPEYNHSYSRVLKNAIDWISRPYTENPFVSKVVAIFSASTGSVGGSRAQEHLRVVLNALGALVVPRPEVILVNTNKKFSSEGKFIDPVAIELMRQLLKEAVKLAIAVKEADKVLQKI
ncbi:MAG: NADPH-dependent FMN reductase [Thaumarchaeota archaeon]|jgi:chromate reductase|nr:NADPH-dependent FMN reductase [Nitrososphaerota archaeon]